MFDSQALPVKFVLLSVENEPVTDAFTAGLTYLKSLVTIVRIFHLNLTTGYAIIAKGLF